MRIDPEYSCMYAVVAVLITLAIFFLEVVLFRWFFGLFGRQFGFWTTAGIVLVVDIVASKFRGRRS